MKMEGRRESTNVDDRRGRVSTGGKVSMGLGGMAVMALLVLIMGGNPLDVLQMAGGNDTYMTEEGGTYTPTAEEQELATFAKQILAGTEDVWTAEFKKYGKTYQPPKLVLFSGAVQSGCGGATSESGPFYCSADQCVYLDLSFFSINRMTEFTENTTTVKILLSNWVFKYFIPKFFRIFSTISCGIYNISNWTC